MSSSNISNSNLNKAKKKKTDKFYTLMPVIEEELRHYKEHFKGKVVFCNCDDPFESNFFRYFALNFNTLGLKKLITTSYEDSPISGTQLSFWESDTQKKPYKLEITHIEDLNGDGCIDLTDIEILLQHDGVSRSFIKSGDFRSPECVELLDEADIVVTNPPFSLFREYLAMLIEHKKKFIIIGNENAFTYKEIFPLIKDNQIWTGYHHGHTWFDVPDYYTIPDYYDPNDVQRLRSNGYKIDENGKLWRNLGNICWFTNLDIKKRHEDLILYKYYNPEEYPKYDNYDAIEVGKVANIPIDYDGVMGVPITFIEKYNPDQFIILGDSRYHDGGTVANDINVINGKTLYRRILIKKKQYHEN